MREKYLVLAVITALLLGAVALLFPDFASALLVTVFGSIVAVAVIRRHSDQKDFLTGLFFGALLIRLAFGAFVQGFELIHFFGGDAQTYHIGGSKLLDFWYGDAGAMDMSLRRFTSPSMPGWGMFYLVAFIYLIVGKSMLAAQAFCAVIGAATAPLVYQCAKKIFANKRVAMFSGVAIAFFPSFIIWSSQLMKDGLIIFLLVLAIVCVTKLQEKFSYLDLALLLFSLFGILSLRFYIFYMVAIAVAGSFLIGLSHTNTSILRRAAALILVGISLTYLGVLRNAGENLDQYARLERIQRSRMDLARSADSGFGEDIDVSTTEGALTAIPVGLVFLMLAPFPWQVSSLRQAITIPEVLLWWAMIPFMLSGFWYAVRHKLRSAFPILFFSLMLTLAYSIFQGNVGTAYRQRTQIQVFLFIFIGVGWALYKERRDDKKMMRQEKQRQFEKRLQARV